MSLAEGAVMPSREDSEDGGVSLGLEAGLPRPRPPVLLHLTADDRLPRGAGPLGQASPRRLHGLHLSAPCLRDQVHHETIGQHKWPDARGNARGARVTPLTC